MVQIYAKYENVGFVENAISSVKERTRFTCHSVLCKKYTRLMTQSLVEGVM